MLTPLINSLATHDTVASAGYIVGNLVATGAAQFIKAPWGHLRSRRPWIACLVVMVDHVSLLPKNLADHFDCSWQKLEGKQKPRSKTLGVATLSTDHVVHFFA